MKPTKVTRSPGRPKLDASLTHNKRFLFTLTAAQHKFVMSQGGGAWLRSYIDRAMQGAKKQG